MPMMQCYQGINKKYIFELPAINYGGGDNLLERGLLEKRVFRVAKRSSSARLSSLA